MLNTTHLKRCIDTLESSVALYSLAPEDSIEQEVFRNAIVKGFELVQETSFKLLRRALKDLGHSGRELSAMPVKDLLRLAATHTLLSGEQVARWFKYRDNRNETAHDYGECFAQNTLVLLAPFIEDAKQLEARLRVQFGE